jgi:hypothetical protein
MLRTVGVNNFAVEAVPVPVFGTGELIEIGFRERVFACHGVPLSFE